MNHIPDKPRVGRPPVLSPEERRAQLISAATRVFSENGYSGTTMERIAHEAGMSKRTVYQFFEDKRTLLDAVLGSSQQKSPVGPYQYKTGDDPRQELKRTMLRLIDHLLDPDHIVLTRIAISEATLNSEVAESFAENDFKQAVRAVRERIDLIARDAGLNCEALRCCWPGMFGALLGPELILALTACRPQPLDHAVLEERAELVLDVFAPRLGLKPRRAAS